MKADRRGRPDDVAPGNGKDRALVWCDECGAPITYGAWPFCASPDNPEGHEKGTYSFSTGTAIRKWGRGNF